MDAEVLPEWIPDEEVSQVSELPSFIEKKTHGSEHHLLRSIGRTDQNRSARQKAVVAAAALLVGATALCVALVASKGATSPLPPQMPFSDAGGLQAWLQLQSNVTRIFAVHIESVAAGSVADVHAGQLSAVADAFAAAAHVSSSAVAITIAPSSVRLTVDILCVSRAAAIAVAALLAPLLSSGPATTLFLSAVGLEILATPVSAVLEATGGGGAAYATVAQTAAAGPQSPPSPSAPAPSPRPPPSRPPHLVHQTLEWREQTAEGELGPSTLSGDGSAIEFTVWADCVSVEMVPVQPAGLQLTDGSITWATGNATLSSPPTTGLATALRVCFNGEGEAVRADTGAGSTAEGGAVTVASVVSTGASLSVDWDAAKGETRVLVPNGGLPTCGYGGGCAATHDLAVSVAADPGTLVRLVVARNFATWKQMPPGIGSEITGLSAAWREGGVPSGRAVQVSKNWHTTTGLDAYEGFWWTLNSAVVVPPAGTWSGTTLSDKRQRAAEPWLSAATAPERGLPGRVPLGC